MTGDSEDVDTSRKTVKTFVPAYQKAEWKRHADDLGMSQSEFVRTMVQAGRRDFDLDRTASETGQSASGDSHTPEQTDSDTSDASGATGRLEDHVVAALSGSEYLSWDELLDRLTSDIEDRLDETLQELQADNRVQYSGRHGGYALTGGTDGR